jgi:DnaK suppressor protein
VGSRIASRRSGYDRPVPAPTDDVDLAAVRRVLQERRDRAREQVAALARPPELGAAQGFGKRIGDGTVEAIGRLTEIGVGSSLEQGLARTERALAKLDDGTYGTCDACGEPIATARLLAMPDRVTCLACAGSQRTARPPRRR